jgi:hypothetical protein
MHTHTRIECFVSVLWILAPEVRKSLVKMVAAEVYESCADLRAFALIPRVSRDFRRLEVTAAKSQWTAQLEEAVTWYIDINCSTCCVSWRNRKWLLFWMAYMIIWFNPLKPALHLNNIYHLFRTSQETLHFHYEEQPVSSVLTETIAVYCDIHSKHRNELCGKDAEISNVKEGGTYSYHCDLNGYA